VIILTFYFIIFLIVVFLISHQLDNPGDYSSYASDIGSHIFFVEPFFEGKVYIPHPLWHIFVHYMNYITLDDKFSAAFVTALLVLLWLYIVQSLYTFFVDQGKQDIYLYAFLFIVFVIGPAYIPLISKFIITGTGGPNIWNNITLFTVKPFAILTVFFTILGLEKKHISYYIFGAVSLLISIFAKPSFVIAFLPALVLFMIIKKFYSKENLIYFSILSLISVSALAYQFLHTFGEGEGKSQIIISFLGVWSPATSNVFVSIILALLFPLLYFIFNLKDAKKNNYLVLTWIMTFVSIAYAAFLAESGPRFNHGNFFWSYMISLSLLYVFSLIDYFKNMVHIKPFIKLFLNIILSWQILVGLFYFIKIMIGDDPAGVVDYSKIFH
jgi:hypothetical protein